MALHISRFCTGNQTNIFIYVTSRNNSYQSYFYVSISCRLTMLLLNFISNHCSLFLKLIWKIHSRALDSIVIRCIIISISGMKRHTMHFVANFGTSVLNNEGIIFFSNMWLNFIYLVLAVSSRNWNEYCKRKSIRVPSY